MKVEKQDTKCMSLAWVGWRQKSRIRKDAACYFIDRVGCRRLEHWEERLSREIEAAVGSWGLFAHEPCFFLDLIGAKHPGKRHSMLPVRNGCPLP